MVESVRRFFSLGCRLEGIGLDLIQTPSSSNFTDSSARKFDLELWLENEGLDLESLNLDYDLELESLISNFDLKSRDLTSKVWLKVWTRTMI